MPKNRHEWYTATYIAVESVLGVPYHVEHIEIAVCWKCHLMMKKYLAQYMGNRYEYDGCSWKFAHNHVWHFSRKYPSCVIDKPE